ncbi:unnamed protein product [Rotaria sp. Silwood1]|nr:unnamed protein product [Rotaria sp. Silwood1]
MNHESQRHFGNFIKKNDLPVPFAYYIWNKKKNIVEYKINFNLLAETMCLTTTRYILQVGSESTIGMGKTSMLQFIFPDKRIEALNTDGSSTLRNGSIDVLFPSDSANQNNESYVIFDVHGTINALNEDIITSIQEYCALQILYVTEKDLKSTFLSSMMNYSQHTQAKPTLVIIFDLNYDNKHHQPGKLIDAFQLQYKNWKYVRWVTAPSSTIWYQIDSNKKNKDLARSQRLQKSLREIPTSLDKEIGRQIYCTSIFSIQSYYLAVKTSINFNPPINCRFKIVKHLDELFGDLDEIKENLRIVTPVSYLDSEIKQCERDLSNNWDAPQTDLHNRREALIRQRSAITTMGPHTKFFVELLTSDSYVELLITEKYLEKWRSRFEPTLHKQLTETKMEAFKFSSKIKQFEQVLSADEKSNPVNLLKIKEELRNVRAEYEKQRTLVTKINKKLMNIDLTIGLFCDEIMALYDHLPRIFNSEGLIQSLAKKLVNLMLKGFAIHILRGRPLRCDSKLIEECIKFIPTTQQPPLVLTVIGEQSSAKSSLMNTTFGCNFRVSAGRCTIGMYMSVIRWKSETIVILDTEGLLSLEEAGSIFDNQMVTMAMLSSHLVLINHKGEFSSKLKDLIGMSFYAKLQICSPIKPKLLFVLRDQADLTSKATFFRQLAQLKEQLQNDSKFLKISIDEELDINNENVYLLPNAFSHDVNSISNIPQCWRNQTFPKEIITLRDIIFNNIISTTKTQKFQFVKNLSTPVTAALPDPQTPINEPAYADLTHLYGKISSNWEAIDKLGPKLLQCKTLHELSIMNELQAIANEIIKTKNVNVYRDGENIIDQTLLKFSSNNFIDKDHDRIVEEFNHQLSLIIKRAIEQAQSNFNDKTERSCYLPEIKSKVSKSIESPIYSVKHLLKEIFEERLHDLLRRARINDAQKQLLDSVQKTFDQNKCLKLDDLKDRLENKFQNIIEKIRTDLQSSFETPTMITEKILKFYNTQLHCKQAETTRENIYNLLYPLNKVQYEQHIQIFINCLSQVREQQNQKVEPKSGGIWNTIKSRFTGSSDNNIDSVWIELKDKVKWFPDKQKDDKNKKLFAEIWNVVLLKFEEELSIFISNTKSISSDPTTVENLFQFIENAMNSQSIMSASKRLEKHKLCADLALIGLDIIIKKAIDMEQANYESKSQNSINEMKERKENLLKQCSAMKNSFELGQTLAKTIGEQIITDIGRLLQRRIVKDINEDIVKSQFINHEAIQKQAYEESISQANGENILKYVYDINRYFIELSLKEIKTTFHAVTHSHTLNFQQFIILTIDKVKDVVQRNNYEDTSILKYDVENAILSFPDLKLEESVDGALFKVFSLNNIISMPIQDIERFKQGFSSIGDFYNDVKKRVTDLTKNMKAEAFESCKGSISKRLGCQARCPGCGAKCSKPKPHDEEEVEVWHDSCKKCSPNNCTCQRSNSSSVKTHETTYHLASAFNGWRYHKLNTPCLELCYQHWTTAAVAVLKSAQSTDSSDEKKEDDDEYEYVFPRAKYFNTNYLAWYNNLKKLSTEGDGCKESIPPPDQRRAWMVVRHTLVNRHKNKMVDNEEYDNKLYPSNVESLPADFEPNWKDIDFA